MRFIYASGVDTADSLTPTSEAEGFDADNIATERLSSQWVTVGVTGQNVVIDAGSGLTITADAIGICGHNISSGATVTVQAGTSATAVVSSPTTTETITRRSGVMMKFFTSDEQRYWAITLEDATNPDGNIKIGRVMLGEYMELDPSSLVGFNVAKQRNDQVSYSPGRQMYADEGVEWREFSFQFPRTGYTTINKVEVMYAAVGNHSGLVFANFQDLWDYDIVFPVYCSIIGGLSFQHARSQKYTYGLTLREVR